MLAERFNQPEDPATADVSVVPVASMTGLATAMTIDMFSNTRHSQPRDLCQGHARTTAWVGYAQRTSQYKGTEHVL